MWHCHRSLWHHRRSTSVCNMLGGLNQPMLPLLLLFLSTLSSMFKCVLFPLHIWQGGQCKGHWSWPLDACVCVCVCDCSSLWLSSSHSVVISLNQSWLYSPYEILCRVCKKKDEKERKNCDGDTNLLYCCYVFACTDRWHTHTEHGTYICVCACVLWQAHIRRP